MKRFLSVVITVLILLSILPVSSVAEELNSPEPSVIDVVPGEDTGSKEETVKKEEPEAESSTVPEPSGSKEAEPSGDLPVDPSDVPEIIDPGETPTIDPDKGIPTAVIVVGGAVADGGLIGLILFLIKKKREME